jgi:DNA polymerase (family 10)
MAMNKHEIARIFQETGLLLELKGENPFKTRAYYNGARALELLQEDLEELVREKRLTEIKGIGKTLAENIEELVLKGKLSLYDELRTGIPGSVVEMLKIPGLGPKKVRLLYEQLHITGIRELEYAIKENRLAELPGFGEKTQNRLLLGIEYLKSNQGLYYYAEALRVVLEILEALKENPGIQKISLAGSLRRAMEVVKNIDLVATGEKPTEIIRYFSGLSQVEDILILEDNRASVILKSGIQADLRAVPGWEYAPALRYYTGSKEHNQALAHLAAEKGLTINQHGIFRGKENIECFNEEDLFRMLGLFYIPPDLREILPQVDFRIFFHSSFQEVKPIQDSIVLQLLIALECGHFYLGPAKLPVQNLRR